MKHRICALTALLLAMSTVVSCNNTPSETSETSSDTSDNTVEPETTDRITELGEKNFGGATYTILDTHGDVNTNIPDEHGKSIYIFHAIYALNTCRGDSRID